MKRRLFLAIGASLGLVTATITPVEKVRADDDDDTPMQFLSKKSKDLTPLVDELTKYPKCPYCGMSRKDYHFSRHLIHYSDDRVDGTCSIHCAAISLSLNLDREPKAIYAPDNSSEETIKPLINAETATYVIGGNFKAVMTRKPKTSFASEISAEAAKGEGELADFEKTLAVTYQDMADDTKLIRTRRDERRRHSISPSS